MHIERVSHATKKPSNGMDENPYSQFKVHDSAATSLTGTPSGRLTFTGFQDGKIKLLSIGSDSAQEEVSASVVNAFSITSKRINKVRINTSTNFNEILVASANTLVQFDYNKSSLVRRIIDERGWLVNNDCNYINGELCACVDNDNSMRLYDLKSRSHKPAQIFRDSKDSLNCFDFKKQRNWIISCGSNDGNVYTYDLRMGKLIVDDIVQFTGARNNNGYGNVESIPAKNHSHPITSISLSNESDNQNLASKYAVVNSLNSPIQLFVTNMANTLSATSPADVNFISEYNQYDISESEASLVLLLRIIQEKQFAKKALDKLYKVDAFLINHDLNIISGSETGEVYVWKVGKSSNKSTVESTDADTILKTFNSYMTTENQSNKLLANVAYLASVRCVVATGGDGKLHIWENVRL